MNIGTDIIEIARVRALIDRYGVLCRQRIFTEQEWDYCTSRPLPYPSFAVRFAAKEAVAKALGVGFGHALKWISVEILNCSSGEPYVVLDALGKRCLVNGSATHIRISLSHCKQYAVAVALLEP